MDAENTNLTKLTATDLVEGAAAAAGGAISAQAQLALQAAALIPGQDGQLVLPDGVGLDDIRVSGRDLIVKMPDGSEVVIPDGAIFVPQLIIGGIAVPPANLAALLIGLEPQPAAGPPQSSGGNFAQTPGDIGDPFGLGDLLPPTELAFPQPETRELIPGIADEEVTAVIVTPDQPAGATAATASVNEAGLPPRGSEPPGSNEAANSETTTGSIVYDAPDGLGSVTINGTAVTGVGQVITTPLGRLTITSIAPGNIGYTYTLADNSTAPNPTDPFTVIVTDTDGDSATVTLTISVLDDAPTARNDTDSVPAGTYAAQTGNVITGVGTTSGAAGIDTQGADGASVSGFRAGTSGNFAAAGTTINGQYGTLRVNADGSYSYTRNAGTPGGVNDTFSYQLTDGDGDTSTATLVIAIGDSPATVISVPSSGAGTVVDEEGLPARGSEPPGSNAAAPVESTSGTIIFTAPDGVASVQLNGITVTGPGQVITTPTGTLTITSFNPGAGTLGYTFTLTDNTSGDSTTQPITVTVTDTDGDSDSENFTITIVDDNPTARNDSASQSSENAPITVNVFANDTPGADGVSLSAGVALVPGSLSGTGTLVYNNDGSFTYTPGPGEQGSVTFQYRITDGDGDPSTATVTINLVDDSQPAIELAGDRDVAEAGLPARGSEPPGSDSASNSETAIGTINVSTGNDSVQSLVINGVNVTSGGTVVGAHGTLTITVSAGVYSYSYTLTDNTSGDATTDSFAVVLTDSDGDVANDILAIAIIDDKPVANDDTDHISAGSFGPATGNVITDAEGDGGADVQGADGASVTAIVGTAAGIVGGATSGQYGVLTLNADGSYSYVRNPGTPAGVSDVFTYTLTDGDGDSDTATLTITIGDSQTTLDLPTKGEAGTSVDEAGLPAGSDAASNRETTSGVIAYTAPDGPAVVTIDGVAVTAVGQTFTGAFGTLTITSIAPGAIGYSYTLTTNTSGDSTFDDFAVVVTDQDGDNTPGTLVIDIVDDVPTARADVDSVTEDDFSGESESVSADGNVLTGIGGSDANLTDGVADTKGADGATVTAVAFGATSGTVGSALSGAYGTLTLNADGSYRYVLDNFNPAVQGLDGNDTLTEVFTYTITDGDGDPSTTTLTITINGSDDPISINGLNAQGPDLVVDEDDLADGSSPNAPALTQTGSFTINGTDGIASIKVEGTEAFVGQQFATAFGTFTITSISAPANGSATSITIGYSYVLTDNSAHPNANGENFLTELFGVEVTDTDGSVDSDEIEVRIVDDVPTAADDGVFTVGEGTAIVIDALGNDVKGADGVALATGVAIASGPTKGTVVYNGDGTFTYTPNPGAEGSDSFTYTITDADGDSSTATVTLQLSKDSIPSVLSTTDLTVDEDGLPGANVDDVPLQANPAETDSTESATASGSAVVDFGSDVPANLLASIALVDTPALDGQLQTLDGNNVVFALEGGKLVGRSGGVEVVRIEISGAVAGPGAGQVTYSYTATLLQPVKHLLPTGEDGLTLTGVTFSVTDSDTDATTGSFDITIFDDVPSLAVGKGSDAGVVLATQDAETIGAASDAANSAANFAGLFTLTSEAGADGAAAPTLSYALGLAVAAGTNSGLTIGGTAIKLYNIGGVIVGSTALAAPALATDPSVVFSLAVNGSGVVTLTQYQQIDHPLAGDPSPTETPFADHWIALADGLVTLTASATITDNDGDTATDSESIDLGGNIRFDDDGPSVSNTGTAPTLTVDETDLSTDASASFAGAFAALYGADGPGSTVYTLGVVAGPSGLIDVATNEAVQLRLNAGVVEGYISGNILVFTASVDAGGTVTLNQLRAVAHLPNTTDDQTTGLSAANLVTLTAKITDFDGDTASATLNIGDRLFFKDDGPTISLTASGAALILDESLGTTGSVQNEGGRVNNDETLAGAAPGAIGFAQGNLATLGAVDPGADGQASASYTLTVTESASGLVDAVTNQAIVLVQVNATTIEGRVGSSAGAVSFSIAANGTTGAVTVNQFRSIEHDDSSDHDENGASAAQMLAGRVALGVTVTDRDGDTATDTVDVSQAFKFEDDGPQAVADNGSAGKSLTNFNTAFVVDFSASIDDAELNSQIIAVKAAVSELFASTGGAVSTRFIIFASAAVASPLFTSAASALAYLDSLNPNLPGGARPAGIGTFTNYTAAIDLLMANYAPDDTSNNQVFFLSDGNPNLPFGLPPNTSLMPATAAAWNSFVNLNDINVTAIGIGTEAEINTARLQEVDVDGTGTPIRVDDFDDLIATLTDLIGSTPATGDLDANDDFGTDGGRILSITIGTTTYTWDGATTIALSSGGSIVGPSFTAATPEGGSLTLNFATGVWSYTAPGSIPGGGVEVFAYTVIDGDGDTSTSSLTITIGNNTPPITALVTATVDDDGLAGGVLGGGGDIDANAGEAPSANPSEAVFNGLLGITATDSPIAAISFAALNATTITVGQESVTLAWNALTDTLTGTGPRGVLFTVQITDAATGAYTVTLLDNVLHAVTAGENNASVSLNYRVADADGSTATGTLAITFNDDSPAAYSTPPGTATGVNAIGTTDTEALNLPGAGADSPATLGFATTAGQQVLSSGGTPLTFNGQNLFYNLSFTDNSILEARTSATAGAGTLVFSIDLNPGAGPTGQYVYTQYQQLSTALLVPVTNLSSVGGGNVTAKAIDVPSSPYDIVLTTKPGFTVNTNANEIGVGNGQSLDDGDAVRLDFVNVALGSGGNAVATYNEYYSANSFRQDVSGLGGSQRADFTVKAIRIVNNANGQALPADGDTVFYGDSNDQTVSGTTLNIYNASGTLLTAGQISAAGITVSDTGGGVWQILNLPNNYDYEIVSATTPFQAVQVDALAGTDTFKLGILSTSVLQIQGASFNVPIRYTDADGDFVTSTINVNLSAPAAPIVIDLDGDGAEFLSTAAGVAFDYAGDGDAENTAWVGADDALLAFDANGDGVIDKGSEIVFGGNGLTDLEGLAATHDSNKDGVLDAADADFAKFGVWQDANSNGVTDAGEFRSLGDAGIVRISLTSDGKPYSAADGDVTVHGTGSFTRADGSTGSLADASFAVVGGKVAANENDQRVLASGTTGMGSAMVAAGLIAAVAPEATANVAPSSTDIAGDAPSQAGEEAAAIAAPTSEPAAKSDFFQPTDEQSARDADNDGASKSASFEKQGTDGEARVTADDHSDQGGLIADLLAPTEIDHSAFAQPAFALAAHVDAASEALIAAQKAGAVEDVVADALAGGSGDGPNVDALLDALAGPVGDQPMLGDMLTTTLGDAGSFEALGGVAMHDMLDQLASAHMEMSAATGQHA